MTGRTEPRAYPDANSEPVPTFASDAEIKLAEQLRRRLEEQYFGSSAEDLPSGSPSKQGH